MVPTIHMNGTSKESLIDGYAAAANALRSALEALAACRPNGRDFYPQGEGAINVAQQEHDAREETVRGALFEVELLLEALVLGGQS